VEASEGIMKDSSSMKDSPNMIDNPPQFIGGPAFHSAYAYLSPAQQRLLLQQHPFSGVFRYQLQEHGPVTFPQRFIPLPQNIREIEMKQNFQPHVDNLLGGASKAVRNKASEDKCHRDTFQQPLAEIPTASSGGTKISTPFPTRISAQYTSDVSDDADAVSDSSRRSFGGAASQKVHSTSPDVSSTSPCVNKTSLNVSSASPYVNKTSLNVSSTSLYVNKTSLNVSSTSPYVNKTSLNVRSSSASESTVGATSSPSSPAASCSDFPPHEFSPDDGIDDGALADRSSSPLLGKQTILLIVVFKLSLVFPC
jgi:hypothetical protein